MDEDEVALVPVATNELDAGSSDRLFVIDVSRNRSVGDDSAGTTSWRRAALRVGPPARGKKGEKERRKRSDPFSARHGSPRGRLSAKHWHRA